MAKISVCLVFPRLKYVSGDMPLGLGYLAAYLKRNTEADISVIDSTFMHSFRDIIDSLGQKKPDIVGIYADVIMARDSINIADWARSNKLYVIFGGPHPTVSPETFIDHADIVVRGEGELTLLDIVNNFGSTDLSYIPGIWWNKNGQIVKTPPSQRRLELDEIPFPSRDLFPMDKYIYNWTYLDSVSLDKHGTTMITSRGCPFNCSYCQPTLIELFGKKVRLRSVDNVLSEILELKERYGINGIFFHDDTMTMDHRWVNEFCRRLDKERLDILWGCNSRVDTIDEEIMKVMYDAGLRSVHFGVESGSQRVVNEIYNKRIDLSKVKDVLSQAKRIGIHTMGFFMIGAPSETEEEIEKTISFAKDLELDEASFSLTTPLIGTDLHSRLLKDSMYSIDKDYEAFDYYVHYPITGGIPVKRIKRLQFRALFSFYLHPKRLAYILKHLLTIRGLKKLYSKLRRFIRCG